MKDQLLLLQRLQDTDIKTKEVRQSIEALPAKLAPAKQDLVKLEALLGLERAKIAETEAWKTEQEELVSREEAALKSAKAKLQAAKNARDFGAASREVDNKKRSIHDREQEVLKVYEALETSRSQLTAHEADVAKLAAHVETEESKFSGKMEELEILAKEISAGREAIASQIDESLLKRYDNVIHRRGVAVVSVVNGVCQGCHMTLPPQLNNILARLESIETCRQCNRLLYRSELLDDSELQEDAG